MKKAAAIGGLWLLVSVLTGAEELKVATFNVENYGPADRVTAAGYRKAYPKPEAAKQALRTILRGLAADVVVLQEMGGQPYLDELKRDLAAEGLNYPFSVLLEAEDTDRHVALLSRRPLKTVVQHTDLAFKYFNVMTAVKRGLLEVVVETAAGEVTLWTLHLKSRFTDRPDDPMSGKRRAGEATAIRDCVLARFPDPAQALYLIAGDFNDVKTSAAVRYLLKRGKTVIAGLVPIADSHGEAWTYVYRKEDVYNRVDHVLVSPGLSARVRGGRGIIYDGPGALEASDHRPVMVTLDLSAKRPVKSKN